MKSLTIVVPTIGRRSLAKTLLSFAPDVSEADYVYVECDGHHEWGKVRRLVAWMDQKYDGHWFCENQLPPGGSWGHAGRNHVLSVAGTDYVWTIDDDDVAAPDSLNVFRSQDAAWVIFRMTFDRGHPARGITCWREKVLQHGDIGTPMILARPCGARFGLRYEGDFDYVQSLQAELGDPVWDDRVVAYIRPEETDATT